jgi:Mrp family chromosome partitioning ATPase
VTSNPKQLLQQNAAIEPYRVLHARTFARAGDRRLRTILFTASDLEEGCSTVAGNLAIYASHVEPHPVLLLELDVLHPSRRPVVPAPRKAGLCDVLAGELKLEDAIHHVTGTRLHLLAGVAMRRDLPALETDRALGELLERLKRDFHYVIADGPTVNGTPPLLPLLKHFDGVILVTRANRTRRQVAARSIEQIKSGAGNFLGVVMNQRRFFIPRWIYGRL